MYSGKNKDWNPLKQLKLTLVLIASDLDGMGVLLEKLGPFIVELNIHMAHELEKLKEDSWKSGAVTGPGAASYQ